MHLQIFKIVLWLFIFPLTLGKGLSNACEYAGSNISYIRTNTEKAIGADKMNLSHYYAYKALSAIDKSKGQFEACGCEYAQQNIMESERYLKQAIKASTILSGRILLEKSMEYTLGSLEALEDHAEIHVSEYGNDLAINTTESVSALKKFRPIEGKALEVKVDSSLINFSTSLDKVITTLPCREAQEYVNGVYERCELELLKPHLTEGKRYYNLRTKEIAARALTKLQDRCDPEK
jgi:hypothetical protein